MLQGARDGAVIEGTEEQKEVERKLSMRKMSKLGWVMLWCGGVAPAQGDTETSHLYYY